MGMDQVSARTLIPGGTTVSQIHQHLHYYSLLLLSLSLPSRYDFSRLSLVEICQITTAASTATAEKA
jgi:hypothetical protein